MLTTLTNARFSVPENPVMRGLSGFGLLQSGNGTAFGQSVDMAQTDQGFSAGWLGAGGSGGNAPVQVSGPNGALVWAGGAVDGSPFTADYCNKIILGGTATDAEKFQCSLRGYVGAAPVYKVPPALRPDPPTSVTIPQAIQRVNAPRVAPARAMRRCEQSAVSDEGSSNLLVIGGLFALGFLLFGGASSNG